MPSTCRHLFFQKKLLILHSHYSSIAKIGIVLNRYLQKISVVIVLFLSVAAPSKAISLNLDSIAEWGKFPRFCIGVYRWGDRFFNSYDSTYVQGTGYKFNVKITTDSWFDFYNFTLPEKTVMHMRSEPSTSVGAHLTYLAVSVGYDLNFSKLFGGSQRARQRYNFGFNCSLFAAELSYVSNDVGTKITRFGTGGYDYHIDYPFRGINVSSWSLDTYYFFNHKRYSQAAAFNFSKLQRKSQGSFYAGISIYTQHFNFDFSELPQQMLDRLPQSWPDYHYNVKTHNYAARVGYGYNWALGRHWLIGITESPVVGLKKGFVNSAEEHLSCSLYNRFGASVVWNSGHWFFGAVGKCDIGLIYDKEHTFANAFITGQMSVGYRFNLW